MLKTWEGSGGGEICTLIRE